MTPGGFEQADESCHGCPASHVTVWWTSTDRGFRRYCRECWARLVGVFKP